MPKRRLREQYMAIRHAEHAAFDAGRQRALRQNLLSLPAFTGARTLLLYTSIRDELPTHALIASLLAAGRRVALPAVVSRTERKIEPFLLSSLEDLAPGPFGVPEPRPPARLPCPPAEIEAALIPGLAFDLGGHRLGHWLGYYDRFLPLLSCPLIGLCYDAQISSSPLPHEAHDHPVDFIVSEKRVVACRRARE